MIGQRIFVVGGRAGPNTAALEAYSPATNTWQRLADLPTARGGLAADAGSHASHVEVIVKN